ncbi:unnamed protein product [Menidia menidia]|uniref:(Atlantic silverside) hypothetical protein n=1 Tax=Menidia menidia TaxID=238744 RepID=A0A8S4BUY1_9TELE|nr:unnamed protein product [Menidia menidia]
MAAWSFMICFVFVALSLKVLLSYSIIKSHSRSPDFWVYCGIDGCEQDFRVFNSFFRHIKRTHFHYLRTGCPPSGWSTTPSSWSLGQETFAVSVFASCSTPAADSTVAVPPDPFLPEPSPQPDADFCLESIELLRSQTSEANSTVNRVISGVQQYQTALVDMLRERIRRVFEENPDKNAQLQGEALATFDAFLDPFSTTAYGQNKTIRELFNPVNPEEVVVSQKICWVKRGLSRVMTLRGKSFYYLPLIQSLKQLLTNPRIFTMLTTVPQRSEGFFYDFTDGALFTSHPLYSQRPNALQILLYTD